MIRVYWFRHVLGSPGLQALLPVTLHRLRCQRDDRQPPQVSVLPDHLHRLITIHLGHHNVHQHNRNVRRALQHGDCLAACAGGQHRHASAFQNTAQREDVADVIIDHQHLAAHQRLVGAMQPLKHALLLRRKIRNHAMQEERRLIQQTLRRLNVLYDNAARQCPQPRILIRRQLLACKHHDRKLNERGRLLHPLQHLDSGHVRQSKVQNHAVERLLLDLCQRIFAGIDDRNVDVL